MTATTRWVVEYPTGGWAVEKEHRERVSDILPTQEAAMARAREIIHNIGGGEMIVQDRHGRIRLKDTIAPGHDPRSTPG